MFTPEKVTFEGQDYTTVARTRTLLVSRRKLGSCCTEWLFNYPELPPLKFHGETEAISTRAMWDISTIIVDQELANVSHKTFKVNDVDLPVYAPETIPGTSKGVQYKTLAVTNAGYVSYRPDAGTFNSTTRIRIAKVNDNANWPTYSIGNGHNWESINSAHLAQNSHNAEQAKILIARGLDALFKLDEV